MEIQLIESRKTKLLQNCNELLYIPFPCMTVHSTSLQTFLIKKGLVSPPMEVPRNIKMFFRDYTKGSKMSSSENPYREGPSQGNVDENSDYKEVSESVSAVMNNYLLLKNIFSNVNGWQELKMYKSVSKTWADAVRNLALNNMQPRYFLFDGKTMPLAFIHNKEFNVEPAYVLVFITRAGMRLKADCTNFPENGCSERCHEKHKMLDYLYTRLCYPTNNLVAHESLKIVYSPPLLSHEINLIRPSINYQKDPCVSGIFIPKIPGVSIINIKISNKQQKVEPQIDFATNIAKMMETKMIKCLLMFRKDFGDLDVFDILVKLIEAHDETQVAIGGCCIERTTMDNFNHLNSHRSFETVFTFFTVDRFAETPSEFDAYSKIFYQELETESDMVLEMKKFADNVPKREHSAALKLSCIARCTKVAELEDKLFRQYFPTTSLVGCYGQGEVGTDSLLRKKSAKHITGDDFIYSYSSVFVVFMWGKAL